MEKRTNGENEQKVFSDLAMVNDQQKWDESHS